MVTGTLIVVSGLSGAGKSTLVAASLQVRPDMRYLRTITTRPMRPGEEHPHEYDFVDLAEYQQRKQRSSNWDELAYHGNFYGADVEASKRLLAEGVHVICSIAPSMEILEQMGQVYQTKFATIWVDTPRQIARQRIKDDAARSARHEDDSMKAAFDYIFTPTGQLETDKEAFISLVTGILA